MVLEFDEERSFIKFIFLSSDLFLLLHLTIRICEIIETQLSSFFSLEGYATRKSHVSLLIFGTTEIRNMRGEIRDKLFPNIWFCIILYSTYDSVMSSYYISVIRREKNSHILTCSLLPAEFLTTAFKNNNKCVCNY